jgi:hypothetical protein
MSGRCSYPPLKSGGWHRTAKRRGRGRPLDKSQASSWDTPNRMSQGINYGARVPAREQRGRISERAARYCRSAFRGISRTRSRVELGKAITQGFGRLVGTRREATPPRKLQNTRCRKCHQYRLYLLPHRALSQFRDTGLPPRLRALAGRGPPSQWKVSPSQTAVTTTGERSASRVKRP